MEAKHVIMLLIAMSFVMLLIFVGVLVIHLIRKGTNPAYKNKRVNLMLVFSSCLILSIWCLRYAVCYFNVWYPNPDMSSLNWWEEIFNSFLHTLQTFSTDEDYSYFISEGKKMIGVMYGENVTVAQTIYGLYVSALNVVAPVAGGAIIFEILANVFPKIKLLMFHWAIWKEKYYFSELNSESLALAKSISNIKFKFFDKPVLVFTNVADDESKAELLAEAKLIGAICIKDDLSHVNKNKFGLRKFFLVDEIGLENLQTLSELAGLENNAYLKNSEIYLFTDDEAYVQVEKMIREKLRLQYSQLTIRDKIKLNFKRFSLSLKKSAEAEDNKIKGVEQYKDKLFENKLSVVEDELPIIIPVNSFRNLTSNLLVDIPLYETIVGKEKNKDGVRDLSVTIVGSGKIGKEMFLSTYWFGQILDCNLKINVLSMESEEEFWNKIDCVNPEIRHTTEKGNPILKINRNGDMAEVYCEVNYEQCDAKSSKFIECLTDVSNPVIKTDYFFIALGNDNDNISVANTVRKYVGDYHINKNSNLKTIITYVVYDSELSDVLNRKKFFNHLNDKPDVSDVYMRAIGSLDDMYSANNIFMTERETYAQKADDAYNSIQNRNDRANSYKKRIRDDYKHWANLARGMHTKYKVYSMGLINASLFDFPDSEEEYIKETKSAYDNYMEKISGNATFEDVSLLHKMAWLEHRRWNAFTRVKGFRHTENYRVYAKALNDSSYKQMDLKLHPCLVECDKNGIKGTINSNGIIDEASLLKSEEYEKFDLLDDLSYAMYKEGYNSYDFKYYDYPIC